MDIDTLAKQAGEVANPTAGQLLAGRRQLERATERAGARVVALRQSRRHMRRRWAGTLAAGAALAATLLVVPWTGAPPASAEQVLLMAAQAAGHQPDRSAGAAYWYVRSEVEYSGTEPFQREVWLGRTELTIHRDEVSAGAVDGVAVDRGRVRTEASDAPARFNAGNDLLSWSDLEALPTDPDQLGALLRAKVASRGSGAEDELWQTVTSMLRESPASPALRRALWEVAAGIPDVTLVGPTTDAAGRRGTAIERDETDRRRTRMLAILDPTTGALLEWRDVSADGQVFRLTQLVQRPGSTAPVPQPPLCGPGSSPARRC